MTALLISDLHLDESRPAITELFVEFLESEARSAASLYILGDLFEAWIGDDEDGELPSRIRSALRQLSDSGVRLFVMRGNRDFLYGELFARQTGATLLQDCHLVSLSGVQTLLMHGDLLCTDDVPYQRMRKVFRSPIFQWIWLRRSLTKRRAYAAKLRQRSRTAVEEKSRQIMDVNQHAVQETMRRHGVRRLIHGHTHRPGSYPVDLDDGIGERLVLGDWHEHGSVLVCGKTGCQLKTLPLAVEHAAVT